MRILITGASGYLGQHLLAALSPTNHIIVGTYNGLKSFTDDFPRVDCRQLDVADGEAVSAMLADVNPDCVVHLAAVSSPAACERDPERSRAINVPMALIEALPAHATLIFLSTDQVYDGLKSSQRKGALYAEEDTAAPVNAYGAAKLAFEGAMRAALPRRSVALRSSLILGPPTPGHCRKQSFVQFCDERLGRGEPTDFFSDEWRSVVAIDDIVAIVRWFVEEGGVARAPGVYNMGGPERLSRVEVARAVVRARGHPTDAIRAVPRAAVAAGGPRSPPDISMDSSKLAAATGITMRPLGRLLETAFPFPMEERGRPDVDGDSATANGKAKV